MAVDEAEGGPIEKEGDTHGSLVPCRDVPGTELWGGTGRCWDGPQAVPSHWGIPPPPSPSLPSVLAIPVFTLEVWTWLMRRSCSGFTSTTILMLQRHCRATCGGGGGGVSLPAPPTAKHGGDGEAARSANPSLNGGSWGGRSLQGVPGA